MKKVVTLLCRAPELGSSEFRQRCLESLAKLVSPRVIASFTDVDPSEAGLDPEKTPPPEYDAVLETWHDLPGSPAALEPLQARIEPISSRAFSYEVSEIVQKSDARTWPLGQRSPGIKGIYPVTRRAGMTTRAFVRHWRDVHGPLARRHHVGLSRYVQNVVQGPLTPGAPACDGISELHFPTARDMRERFIDSPEGARRIADDVSSFVGTSMRLDASEYILRD
jgi:uncharacterized protein (TIGR02118 family)